MGKINGANMKKALYYLRRNGILAAYHAARERLGSKDYADYMYKPPEAKVLEKQRNKRWEQGPLFSIIVPVYRTPEKYLRAMIESVIYQTYANWQLILLDASNDQGRLEGIVRSFQDARIHYYLKEENSGISDNTNFALRYATGDYTGLLDHDDMLTTDALYEMASRIEEDKKAGRELLLLYSDEDKCNMDGDRFYEPHKKEDFNLDLLLSNNYICHFMVMETELLKKLKLRRDYEGAQDYDLVLRAVARILPREDAIGHIPRVLYHWRCHMGSTAENPQSKEYAYLAGREALQDFADQQGWKAKAVSLKHVGFYSLQYEPDILSNRPDVGAIGGRILNKGKITGGIYKADGSISYYGLHKNFSGYMHRAALLQDADAVDIRLIHVREECRQLFAQITGVEYMEGKNCFDCRMLPPGTDYGKMSLELGKAFRQAGYRMVWDPAWSIEV